MVTSAQVVETSVNVIPNSPSQDYTHPDDRNLPTYDSVYYAAQGFLAFQSSDEILKCDYSNDMCREHYFVVLLFFIMLYKVVLTLEIVDKNLTSSVPIQVKATKLAVLVRSLFQAFR